MTKKLFSLISLCSFLLVSTSSFAGTLQQLNVKNETNRVTAQFSFTQAEKFSYFYLNNPNRLVLDFQNTVGNNRIIPKTISEGIISKIRYSKAPRSSITRVVIELKKSAKASFSTKGNSVYVIFPQKLTLKSNNSTTAQQTIEKKSNSSEASQLVTIPLTRKPIIIAIDAGHGGKDPGTIGTRTKIYEKNVTLAIAKKLMALFNKDPRFKGVYTRKGDYFISVSKRSEIARKNKANYLVSIHADANPSPKRHGASVWVLSNRRASSEMGKWLENHENQSELLGGAGDVLGDHHNDKYLDQTVLDLQFGHSQRAGYEVGKLILGQISKFSTPSLSTPQHASLGVLRSPDIPSVLVESGFLSNAKEERLLATSAYQEKIAKAIYNAFKIYYIEHDAKQTAGYAKQTVGYAKYYKVKAGDTLSEISRQFNIKMSEIQALNKIKNNNIYVGQKLRLN